MYVEVCKVEVEALRFTQPSALSSVKPYWATASADMPCAVPLKRSTKPSALAAGSSYRQQLPGTAKAFPPPPRLAPAPTHTAAEHASLHGVVYICICISVQLVAHVLFTHWMLVKNTVSQSRLSVEMSSNGFQTTLFL